MKPKSMLRSFLLGGPVAAILASSAHAANFVWNNSNVTGAPVSPLDWFTSGPNTLGLWTGAAVPVSSSTSTIQFFLNNTTALLNTAVSSTQISNLNNGGSAFQLGNLTLSGLASATTSANLTMTLSGDALNFPATTGTINLDAINATRTITYNINSAIQLGTASSAGTLTLTGSGSSAFNIGGIISELQAGGGSIIKSGSSTATLTNANSYTGATTLGAGTLNLSGAGTLLTTSGITLAGGGLTLTNTAAETGSGRVHDTNVIASNGGTITYTNTSGANVYAETIGTVALTTGQLNLVETTTQASTGSQTLTLAGLTHPGSSSAVTFSAATTAPNATKNMIAVTGAGTTAAGEIVGPWATTGTSAAVLTDYAVYSSGFVVPANIAASVQSTWSTAWANTSNYTLTATSGVSTKLDATRNINSLRNTSTASNVTVDAATDMVSLAAHTFSDGDVIAFGGTAPGGTTTGTPYYVRDAVAGVSFKVSASSGGAVIDLTSAGTPNIVGGITLPSGFSLGTYGILNTPQAALAIGGDGGTVTLPTTSPGNLYVTPGNTGLINISSPISDNGAGVLSLVKNGSGSLTLSGTNSFTGAMVVNAGTLTITGTSSAAAGGVVINGGTFKPNKDSAWGPNSNTLTFGGNGTFDVTTFGSGYGTTTHTGAIQVNSGVTATILSSFQGPSTISAPVTGSGTLILSNPSGSNSATTYNNTGSTITGTLRIDNASANIIQMNSLGDSTNPIQLGASSNNAVTFTYAGSSNLTSRYLELPSTTGTYTFSSSGSGTVNISQNLAVTGAGAKTFVLGGSNTGNNTFSGIIPNSSSGATIFTKTGAGTWVISGANSYTGKTSIQQGILSASSINSVSAGSASSSLGAPTTVANGTIDIGFGTTTSGTLLYTGAGETTDRVINLAATTTGGAAISHGGTGLLKFTSDITNASTGAKTLTLQGPTTGMGEFSGKIVNGTGVGGSVLLSKFGASTWRISGANTYTGATSINAGALEAIDGTGLPTASILQIRGGVFQSSGTFSRTVGTASGNVNWSTSSGGFAARGGTLNIQLNAGTGSLTWNGSSMVQTGQALIFGSSTADSLVDFQNAINLGSSLTGQRTITVNDNTASSSDIARISGAITNTATGWGILKDGAGTLELTGANTYTGTTTVSVGTLKLGASDVLPNASNIIIGTGTLDTATFTDTTGTLDVSAAAAINLGSGATLAFADSNAVDWTGGTLNITGTFVSGSSLRFGTTNAGLTSAQLLAISATGFSSFALDANGFLTATGGGGPGPLDHFAISAIGSPQTVGTPITGITLTAQDASNATITSFSGTVTFGGTGGFTGTSATFTAGVLNSVSVTPTVAGSNLTFTVSDSGKSGSTTITTIQSRYDAWSGGAAFSADANSDSVNNGMAWVLGALNPSANAIGLLPTFDNTTDPDYFIYTYRRSDAAFADPNTTIAVQYGSALTGWTTAVHDGTNIIITPTDNAYGVSPGVDKVEVKIKRTLAVGSKLFARLNLVIAP